MEVSVVSLSSNVLEFEEQLANQLGITFDQLESAFKKSQRKFLKTQIIADPTPDLAAIYEQRVLIDLSTLRAEKYDSPEQIAFLNEWRSNHPDDLDPPLNQPNQNFAILLTHYHQILETDSMENTIKEINRLRQFLDNLSLNLNTDWYRPTIYKELFDVRCCQSLNDYADYLLTKKYQQIQEKLWTAKWHIFFGHNQGECLEKILKIPNLENGFQLLDELATERLPTAWLPMIYDQLYDLNYVQTVEDYLNYCLTKIYHQ